MLAEISTSKFDNDHTWFPQITLAPFSLKTSVPLRDALKSQCHWFCKSRISVDPEKYLDRTGDTYIQISFIGKDRGRSTDRSTGRPTNWSPAIRLPQQLLSPDVHIINYNNDVPHYKIWHMRLSFKTHIVL